jgi:hypothetical protein
MKNPTGEKIPEDYFFHREKNPTSILDLGIFPPFVRNFPIHCLRETPFETVSGGFLPNGPNMGHHCCSFYKLAPLLLKEARLVETRIASGNMHRDVRPGTVNIQTRLDDAWNRYDAGEISAGHFLRLCSALYAPSE